MGKILNMLFWLAILCFSCSKDEETKQTTEKSTSVTVKYDVTWSGTPIPGLGSSIAYTNATGNAQSDTNLSGSSWTKTFTVNTKDVKGLALLVVVTTSKAGTSTVKISLDGKVRSENQAPSINASAGWFLHKAMAEFTF